MLGEARLKIGTGDLAGALAIVEGLLAKSPNLVDGWQMKGDIAGTQAQLENALAAYRKALELRSDNLLAHMRIAAILIQQGKTEEASAQIEQMKNIAPKHPQTLYLQALLAFREKEYVAAREAIQLQLRAAPDNLAGLVLGGNIEYQLGAYAQAETSLLKALQQAPKQRLARMMLVNTYLRNRQPGKALETREAAAGGRRREPPRSWHSPAKSICRTATRARRRRSSPRPRRSIRRIRASERLWRSRTCRRAIRIEASSELEDAAAADPGIRADLALIAPHTRQRKFDAALKAIDDLEKKQPDKPLPHNLRGAVYVGKGDMAAATAQLRARARP